MNLKIQLPLAVIALLSAVAFQNCADAEMKFSEVPSVALSTDSSGAPAGPPIFNPVDQTQPPPSYKLKFVAQLCKAGDLCPVQLSISPAPTHPISFDFATDDAAYAEKRSTAQPNVDYRPMSTRVTITGSNVTIVNIQTLKRTNTTTAYSEMIPVTMSNCRFETVANGEFSCADLQ